MYASMKKYALHTATSQMVHVVSMEQDPMMVGSASFQSKLVSGAQYSAIHTYIYIIEGFRTFIFFSWKSEGLPSYVLHT